MNGVWDIAATALQRLDVIDHAAGVSGSSLAGGFSGFGRLEALRSAGSRYRCCRI